MDACLKMIRKPVTDDARFEHIFTDYVLPLKGAYKQND